MSKVAVISLVAAGAAGAGAAVVLTKKESEPAGVVSGVTASQAVGIQLATPLQFSVQPTGFDAATLTYNWEFGDGATSTDPSPTHTYATPGTYTVVVTVSDRRQSARSEMSVTVLSLSGTWRGVSSIGTIVTMQLTQSGNTIAGSSTIETVAPPPTTVYTGCSVSGVVQPGTPVAVNLTSPQCRNDAARRILLGATFDFRVSADGQTLSGTLTNEGGGGGGSGPFSMQRQ